MIEEQYEEFLSHPGQTRLQTEDRWSLNISQQTSVIIGLHCLAKKTQEESWSAGEDFTPLSMDQDFMECILRTLEGEGRWTEIVTEAKGPMEVGGEELSGASTDAADEIATFKFGLSMLVYRKIIVVKDKAVAGRVVTGLKTDAETTRIIRTVIEYAGRLNEQEISELQRRLNERINALREEKNPDAVLGVRAAQAARLAARAAQVAMAGPAPDTGY